MFSVVLNFTLDKELAGSSFGAPRQEQGKVGWSLPAPCFSFLFDVILYYPPIQKLSPTRVPIIGQPGALSAYVEMAHLVPMLRMAHLVPMLRGHWVPRWRRHT